MTRSARAVLAVCVVFFAIPTAIWAEPVPEGSSKSVAPPGQTKDAQILVDLESWADAQAVAERAGLVLASQSRASSSWYYLTADDQSSINNALTILESTPGVRMAVAGATQKYTQHDFVPDDPYFETLGGGWANPGQWYLDNPFTDDLDIRVTEAWDRGVTGKGVLVGVVDDGLQINHPDLAANVVTNLSWNFGNNTQDPSPVYSSDGHGTSVAGVIGAVGNNGIGVSGVAPEVGLVGLRVDFYQQGDNQFSDATRYRSDVIKVKNHSYGIPIGYIPDNMLALANEQSAAEGVINVRSAGNEGSNANAKQLQASRHSLTVAAMAADGKYAYYSNFGANVFVTAPSSANASYPRITTTDRTGPLGYSDGENPTFPDPDYTPSFGGTSASAAIVSGGVAEILQVNPNLNIRGIKHILARTSRKIDPNDSDWTTNAAGFDFNPNYGFGLIDVDAACRLAETFTQPEEELYYETGRINVNRIIPDDNSTGITRTFDLEGDGFLETVEATFGFTHAFPGDLDIVLTSPSGTESRLAYAGTWAAYMRDWETGQVDPLVWTFSSAAFWGEDLTGTWTMKVSDEVAWDEGDWEYFSVAAYASVPEPATLSMLLVGALTILRRKT